MIFTPGAASDSWNPNKKGLEGEFSVRYSHKIIGSTERKWLIKAQWRFSLTFETVVGVIANLGIMFQSYACIMAFQDLKSKNLCAFRNVNGCKDRLS